ncbi:MAG: dihydrodipicolinate synthase family protein, partial [Planctomycetia bacterium]|nr:dihydrodipicolinate synthase family protein [Planctomycetia bacterium]
MATAFRPHSLRTVQLVPVTAFDGEGRLALTVMEANARRLFEAGIRVFIPCAGSSEFHSLRADEIVAAVAMTRQAVGRDSVVMAPVGLQLLHALEVGRKSLDAGADCLLVMPLDFPYLSDAGAADYYNAILGELSAPTLIYKKAEIPSDRLLLELADHPKVVGVKYAVNDIDAFRRVVTADQGRIDWFCGSAERFAPFFMLAGATGYTSGAGNLCPRLTLAMHAACAEGDWPQAMRLQEIIRPIEDYRARAGSSYNISFLKYAMTHVSPSHVAGEGQ